MLGFAISMFIIMLVTSIILDYFLQLKNFWFYLAFLISNISLTFGLAAFIALSLLIFTRFRYINNMLELIKNSHPEGVFPVLVESQPGLYYGEIFVIYSNSREKMGENRVAQDSRSILQKIIDYFTKNKVQQGFHLLKKVRNFFFEQIHRLRIQPNSSVQEVKEAINRLIYLHNCMCDCINSMNEAFAFNLLVAVAYMFVFIVFALFSGYR